MAQVLFDGSHKEDLALASEGDDGLSAVAADLRADGFELRVIGRPAALLEKTFADVAVTVVAFPKVSFSKAECQRVWDFVHGGGGLLLTAEWGNIFNNASVLNQLCQPWGLTFNTDRVADAVQSF